MEVAGPLGTPLGLAQRKRASPRGEAYIDMTDRVFNSQQIIKITYNKHFDTYLNPIKAKHNLRYATEIIIFSSP